MGFPLPWELSVSSFRIQFCRLVVVVFRFRRYEASNDGAESRGFRTGALCASTFNLSVALLPLSAFVFVALCLSVSLSLSLCLMCLCLSLPVCLSLSLSPALAAGSLCMYMHQSYVFCDYMPMRTHTAHARKHDKIDDRQMKIHVVT